MPRFIKIDYVIQPRYCEEEIPLSIWVDPQRVVAVEEHKTSHDGEVEEACSIHLENNRSYQEEDAIWVKCPAEKVVKEIEKWFSSELDGY